MWTSVSIAISTILVVAVIAHTLSVVLLILMWALHNLHSLSRTDILECLIKICLFVLLLLLCNLTLATIFFLLNFFFMRVIAADWLWLLAGRTLRDLILGRILIWWLNVGCFSLYNKWIGKLDHLNINFKMSNYLCYSD